MKSLSIIAFCLHLFEGLSGQGCACCGEKYRQFDFWLGEWEAYQSDTVLAGSNTIDLIQDSCVIRENWRSANGTFTGTSYNYYDTARDCWTQAWIDNQGGSLLLHGKFANGRMVLSGKSPKDSTGNTVVNRITWTPNPDGTVRQLWESKVDSTEWTVVFNGLYRRVNR